VLHPMIFVNLPIADITRSREFFTALGYRIDEESSDDNALCLEIGETTFVMLLQRDFFGTFSEQPVGDPTATTQHLIALGVETREAVDELVDTAIAAGGTAQRTDDHGFMYYRSYADLDGHVWEVMWMTDESEPQE
jgi:predicted lactoylglutathione lyase